jgi:hypothetical protein
MRSRLHTIAPDLDATLAALPPEAARRAAWSAARWAVERVGLDHPAVAEALASLRLGAVAHLVEELDQRYHALSERHDESLVSEEAVMTAFRAARAAAAVEFAAKGEPIEAVYEAAQAGDEIPAIPAIRQLVASSLGGDAERSTAAAPPPAGR